MWLLRHSVFLVLVAWCTGKIIDVSHFNGEIDWAKVKAAGVTGAIAKVSEGSNIPDHTFVKNWQGMKKHGVKALGAYHYLRGAETPDSQVKLIQDCLKKVDFNPKTDILAIDVETGHNERVTPNKMAETLKGVLDKLKPTYKNIYIYAAPGMESKVSWNKYKKDFSSYKLWVAHYTKAAKPKLLSLWKEYDLWQYTDKGKVNGIAGYVDMDKTK